jgi:hypothetical protein
MLWKQQPQLHSYPTSSSPDSSSSNVVSLLHMCASTHTATILQPPLPCSLIDLPQADHLQGGKASTAAQGRYAGITAHSASLHVPTLLAHIHVTHGVTADSTHSQWKAPTRNKHSCHPLACILGHRLTNTECVKLCLVPSIHCRLAVSLHCNHTHPTCPHGCVGHQGR